MSKPTRTETRIAELEQSRANILAFNQSAHHRLEALETVRGRQGVMRLADALVICDLKERLEKMEKRTKPTPSLCRRAWAGVRKLWRYDFNPINRRKPTEPPPAPCPPKGKDELVEIPDTYTVPDVETPEKFLVFYCERCAGVSYGVKTKDGAEVKPPTCLCGRQLKLRGADRPVVTAEQAAKMDCPLPPWVEVGEPNVTLPNGDPVKFPKGWGKVNVGPVVPTKLWKIVCQQCFCDKCKATAEVNRLAREYANYAISPQTIWNCEKLDKWIFSYRAALAREKGEA